jgi:hypothetical protein
VTRVRRPPDRRGLTTPPQIADIHLVCVDGNRTLTIIDVAERQTAGTRAKDIDRNDICPVLDSALVLDPALAEGQLLMDEHRQRVATATTDGILLGAAETVGLQQKDVKPDSTYVSIDPSRDPVTPTAPSSASTRP